MLIRQVSSCAVIRSANAFGRRLAHPPHQRAAKIATAVTTKPAIGARFLSSSPWANYEMAPTDPIIGLNEEFQKDDFPQKVIVGVGAYRDDAGKPYILPCVREAEDKIFKQHVDMEYSGIVSIFILFYIKRDTISCSVPISPD